jgi:hypothetical protein
MYEYLLHLYETLPAIFFILSVFTAFVIGVSVSLFFERKAFWGNFFVATLAGLVGVPVVYAIYFQATADKPEAFIFIAYLSFAYASAPFVVPIILLCTLATRWLGWKWQRRN